MQLASSMARASNPLLWLACVGLTDHYLTDRIGKDSYEANYETLKDEVTKLNRYSLLTVEKNEILTFPP